ncbi:MAG: hypothetical protein IAI49_05290 [Candidatus Eremiobacteraeota bacterium]|nr:hypothetical protein [Candidatus Eremiobacteraeota bacterium]
MSAFNDHFVAKYFGYRRRYVDYIVSSAPARARLANLSEIARLGFMIAGNVLCAAILWLLVSGAIERSGIAPWPVAFILLALLPTFFALLAGRGIAAAIADRANVQERVGRAANASRP